MSKKIPQKDMIETEVSCHETTSDMFPYHIVAALQCKLVIELEVLFKKVAFFDVLTFSFLKHGGVAVTWESISSSLEKAKVSWSVESGDSSSGMLHMVQ